MTRPYSVRGVSTKLKLSRRNSSPNNLNGHLSMKEVTEEYLQNLKVILTKKSEKAAASQNILNKTIADPNELDIHQNYSGKWPLFNKPDIAVNLAEVVVGTQLNSVNDDEYNRQVIYENGVDLRNNDRNYGLNQRHQDIQEDAARYRSAPPARGCHKDNRLSKSPGRSHRSERAYTLSIRRMYRSKRSESPHRCRSRSPSRSPSRCHHCRCECRRKRSRSPHYRSRHRSCSPPRREPMCGSRNPHSGGSWRGDHRSEISETVAASIHNPVAGPLLAAYGHSKALYWVPKTLLSQMVMPPMPRHFVRAPNVAPRMFVPRHPYRFRAHHFPKGQFEGSNLENEIDRPTSTSK